MEQKRILLAENEPETARFIESELQDLDLIVKTVNYGNEAWKLLQAADYTILICDENLSGLGFVDLATQIRCEPKFSELPIFFIVGKIEKTDIPCPPFPYLADITFERHDLFKLKTWVQKMLIVIDTPDERYLL